MGGLQRFWKSLRKYRCLGRSPDFGSPILWGEVWACHYGQAPQEVLGAEAGDFGVFTPPAPHFTAGSTHPDSGLYSLTHSWCSGGPGPGGVTRAVPPRRPSAASHLGAVPRSGLSASPSPFLRNSLNGPITISIALFFKAPWKSRGFLSSRAAFRKDPGPPAHPGLRAALIPPVRSAETELPLSSAAGRSFSHGAGASLQPSWLQFSGTTISLGGGAAR